MKSSLFFMHGFKCGWKRGSLILTLYILCGIFLSCGSQVSLELKTGTDKSQSLEINFKGECGQAFKDLILAATGGEDFLFDTTEITNQLTASGFSDVKAAANGLSLSLSMKDKGCKSYFFTSGLLSLKADKAGTTSLSVNINPTSLKYFYNSADEQIKAFLDILLAPVFNDENMSPDEYIQMIGAVYGEGVMAELAESKILINKKSLRLADLLCGVTAVL